MTNLKLNLSKTVLVPLWPCEPSQVKRTLINDDHPAWASCEVAAWSRYLGFALGPGKGNRSWDKAIQKFEKRSLQWDASQLGLHFSARAYNTFVVSVFSFLWQLEDVPQEAFDAEKRAIMTFSPGPGTWRLPTDMFYLKTHFGFPVAFQSMRHVALASKLRVCFLELHDVADKQMQLEHLIKSSSFFDRRVLMSTWYSTSIVTTLFRAKRFADNLGIKASAEWRRLVADFNHPMSLRDMQKARSKLQSRLTYLLITCPSINENMEARVRQKVSRWGLSPPLGILSRRLLARLPEIAKLVSPRVHSAIFKTLWNGWATSARFQCTAQCVLKCSTDMDALGLPLAQDKIEHYVYCPFTKHLFSDKFGFQPNSVSKDVFFLAADHLLEHTDKVTLVAIAIYAIMRATNHFRKFPPTSANEVHDFLEEAVKQATSGHRSSQRILHAAMVGRFASRRS